MNIKEPTSLSYVVFLLLLRKVAIDMENREDLNYEADNIFKCLDWHPLLLYHLLILSVFNIFLIQIHFCFWYIQVYNKPLYLGKIILILI